MDKETKVKVIFTNGTSEIFDAENYQHNQEHRMFYVIVGKNRIMIPDRNVRSVGIGRVVMGVFKYD